MMLTTIINALTPWNLSQHPIKMQTLAIRRSRYKILTVWSPENTFMDSFLFPIRSKFNNGSHYVRMLFTLYEVGKFLSFIRIAGSCIHNENKWPNYLTLLQRDIYQLHKLLRK